MFKRSAVAGLAVVLLTAIIAVGAAASGDRCVGIKGTITLNGPDEKSGIAIGTFSGSVVVTAAYNDFSQPTGIRSIFDLTITPRRGDPMAFAMDFVATNFTATGLVGGGLLNELTPPPGTYSSIHVTLGPMDDSPDGSPPNVFSYSGQRCYEQ